MITPFAFFQLMLFLAEHTMKGAFCTPDANVHYFPFSQRKKKMKRKEMKRINKLFKKTYSIVCLSELCTAGNQVPFHSRTHRRQVRFMPAVNIEAGI